MVTLVATIHDPDDRQLVQARRVLPHLRATYASIVLVASPPTSARTIHEMETAGVIVERQQSHPATYETLGTVRRSALAYGLRGAASHIHLCDWDRAIHWADRYPDELREVMDAIGAYDCLILGRTPRAFATHPRVQRDTESIINHAFGLVWGREIDVTAASRGLSRRAAELIVAKCHEPTLGNDCVWPLFLRSQDGLIMGYMATEGLEWETPDRFADEIAAKGGLANWLGEHDQDVAHWADRLWLAQIEVDALRRWCSGS